MYWLIFVFGSLLGGILSVLSHRDRDNVFMRLLSFAVPVFFGALFWYMQYKSGRLFSSASLGKIEQSVINIIITTVVCTLLSKGIGWMIVKYAETKK